MTEEEMFGRIIDHLIEIFQSNGLLGPFLKDWNFANFHLNLDRMIQIVFVDNWSTIQITIMKPVYNWDEDFTTNSYEVLLGDPECFEKVEKFTKWLSQYFWSKEQWVTEDKELEILSTML